MTPAILSPNHNKICSFFKEQIEKGKFWTEIEDWGYGIALFRADYPSSGRQRCETVSETVRPAAYSKVELAAEKL